MSASSVPNAMAAGRMNTLYGIQYLRAFAATAVVAFHAAERAGFNFAIGAAGVDVFFVVSGFIMMVIGDRRALTPLSFLRDRLLRIAPSYWIVTIIMLAGATAGLFPNLKIEPLHVLGSFLFIPVPSPNGGHLWPVLVQGWTLNYEIFFYLLFAAVLLVPARRRLPLLTGSLALFVLAGRIIDEGNSVVAFYTAPLILEFAAGAWLARLWLRRALPPAFVGGFMIGGSLCGFAFVHFGGLEFDAWTCGPLSILLVAGVLAIETHRQMPNMPLPAYVGDASYSIYLWHTLALSVVVKGGIYLGLPPVLVLVCGIVAGIALGLAAYELIEKPIQALVKQRRVAADFAVTRPPGP